MLGEAVARAGVSNVEMQVADAYSLPAKEASVDVAFMATVLGEIPDRKRALAELRRVLKPDGVLCIGESVLDPHCSRISDVTQLCENEVSSRWRAAATGSGTF